MTKYKEGNPWSPIRFLASLLLCTLTAMGQQDMALSPAAEIDVRTVAGKYYQLESSTQLNGGTWLPVGLAIEGTGQRFSKLVSIKSDQKKFWRVRELSNQWAMVWHDEFDGDRLDLSKWGKEENNYGGGNNEAQHYSTLEKYVQVSDGKLKIHVYRDAFTTPDGQKRPYSSGRIRTLQRADFLYGRFEVSAKVPSGQGIWPAVWMLPSVRDYGTWASGGEIDIMESRGSLINETLGTIHFGSSWPNNTYKGGSYSLPEGNFADGFHTYVVDWYEDRIEWWVDGVRWQTIRKDEWFSDPEKWNVSAASVSDPSLPPFDKPFHLIVNVAVNGAFFNGTSQDANALPDSAFPQTLELDYIRVYKWAR